MGLSELNEKRNHETDDTAIVESRVPSTSVSESHTFESKIDSSTENEKSALSLPTLLQRTVELTLRIETRDDLAGFLPRHHLGREAVKGGVGGDRLFEPQRPGPATAQAP